MVVSRHGDDCLTLEGSRAALVHCVAGNGGRGIAGPIERVPSSMIGQAFHGAHICRETTAIGGIQNNKGGQPGKELSVLIWGTLM